MYKNYFSIFLLGFYSLTSQVILIQESFSTFSSNEITAGLLLAAWLLGTGIGNALSRRYEGLLKEATSSLFFINVNFFLIIIVLLRYIPVLFSFPFGEAINIFYFLLFTLCLVLPFALLWGINFNYLYLTIRKSKQAESKAYYLESLGSALASLLVSFVLVRLNSVFLLIGIFFGLLLISLILRKESRGFIFYASGFLLIILMLFHQKMDDYTEMKRFRNLEILQAKETPYGRLFLTQYKNTFSFYQNNVFLFSSDDKIIQEIMASLLVSEAEKLEKLLVIQNGVHGLVENLLLYPEIKKIYYVEYNKDLLNLYVNYIPAPYLKNQKLSIIINDGRRLINQGHMNFDAVLLNTPDPVDLQWNRYYTYEFFQKIRTILNKRGILILKISSSENYMNKFQSMYVGSVYNTLKKVFEDVIMLPGDTCFVLACPSKGVLTYDEDLLRAKAPLVQSEYYKKYFLPFNFNEYRVHSFLNSVDLRARVNHDLRPITFFYHIVLWTSRMDENIKDLFSFFYKINFFWYYILFLCFFLLLSFTLLKKRENVILFSMASMGFSVISLEIITIFLYQILRGNLYYNIGLIFFGSMLGLGAGSYLYQRIKWSKLELFLFLQFAFILLPLFLVPLYRWLNLMSQGWLIDLIFILFVILFSLLSGISFPAAVQLFPEDRFSPGWINSIDLVSSAISAFFVSLFFIPLYGIVQTVFFLAFINAIVFGFMVFRLRWS